MVHNKFAWELVCYYNLITQSHPNLLAQVRHELGDNTQYMEFQYLNGEMMRIYKELGIEPFTKDGRIKWIEQFIRQESNIFTPLT